VNTPDKEQADQLEVFQLHYDAPPKGWKKKYGQYALDGDETIHIPGVLTGRSEMDLILCASFDGEPLAYSDHGKRGVATVPS
jgi:hypothetical protein